MIHRPSKAIAALSLVGPLWAKSFSTKLAFEKDQPGIRVLEWLVLEKSYVGE
jgi:hypothetical protein